MTNTYRMREKVARILHIGLPSPLFVLAVCGGGAKLWLMGHTSAALSLVGSVAVTAGVVGLMKLYTKTPRPTGALVRTRTSSFPSMHAALAGAVAVQLVALAHIYTAPFALVLSVCMALFAAAVMWSRVVLRVHTRAQVFVGAGIGITIALVSLIT